MSDRIDYARLGEELAEYCGKYGVPLEHIFEILNDQKVVPMIRGKGTEWSGYSILQKQLNFREWSIEKLNLNAQPDAGDEDISVTHKRTGVILKVECKSAVRGSMSTGIRSRVCPVPHFKVKCHRSRSNIKLAGTSNDRYSADHFDVILTNPINALFQPRTIGDKLELLHDQETLQTALDHYACSTGEELVGKASRDWRFVFPKDIAESGFVPRTPYVTMQEDPNWRPIEKLEELLLKLAAEKELVRKKHRTEYRRE
jgi:hypothetical protein